MSGVTVERVQGDFSDAELRAIAATLVNVEPDAVCDAALVVVIHTPDGGHDMKVATSIAAGPKQIGGLLAHSALHVYGGCKRCARAHRKGSTDGTH